MNTVKLPGGEPMTESKPKIDLNIQESIKRQISSHRDKARDVLLGTCKQLHNMQDRNPNTDTQNRMEVDEGIKIVRKIPKK